MLTEEAEFFHENLEIQGIGGLVRRGNLLNTLTAERFCILSKIVGDEALSLLLCQGLDGQGRPLPLFEILKGFARQGGED